MQGLNRRIGRLLARFLQKQTRFYLPFGQVPTRTLDAHLRLGDVLLVEGDRRISSAIKYLTHSTWSHAAFYIGDVKGGELIEADLENGVQRAALASYAHLNTRICRPVGLSEEERVKLGEFMKNSLGRTYDLKNVLDLARFFLPHPPVPHRLRRKMLAFGSGDPTRAICSTLLAEGFHHVRYPVLPETRHIADGTDFRDVLHVRHHSLFTPRDFDLSPYFDVIKPTLDKELGRDTLDWEELDWLDPPERRHG